MVLTLLMFVLLADDQSLSAAYYSVRDLYDEYSATVCAARDAGGRRQEELLALYNHYSTEMVRYIAGGELSYEEIQLLGTLPSPAEACESDTERQRREENQAFFDPANQLRLYCLPREDRMAILQRRVPEKHREILQAYMERWEDRNEKTFGQDRERLCKDGEPISAVDRGITQ